MSVMVPISDGIRGYIHAPAPYVGIRDAGWGISQGATHTRHARVWETNDKGLRVSRVISVPIDNGARQSSSSESSV